MDSADELLLLAHGIETYDRVVRDLTDLTNLRMPVPHILLGRAQHTLVSLAQMWWADVHGDPVWHDAHLPLVADEAREWTAGRQVRLSELREGKQPRDN
jgi:hypothetical protein